MSGPGPGADPSAAELVALGVEVAAEAGRLVARLRGGQVEVAATKSSPTDIVTAVDTASERLIRSRLLAAREDDGFLGEEGHDVAGSSGVTWVVDPLDGTVNYFYAISQFAVSIAARVGDEVVAGVVHNPVSGETFTATRGGGAFLNESPIVVSGCTDISKALVGIGFAYRAEVRVHQAVEVARLVPVVRDVRRLGSAALDLCFLACGRLDAYAERGLRPWDLAAGRLVAQEAGATVSGLDGSDAGELLTVGAPTALFPAFQDALLAAGYGDWPMADWPAGPGAS